MACETMLLISILLCVLSGGVLSDNSLGVTPLPPAPVPLPVNPNSRCEEITIPMCRGIGYNLTTFPNKMNHDTQEEAGLEVHQFWPLVEIKCSPDLKFFLCSMYTPICIEDYTKPLPACRSVCERARAGCAPLMQQYGFPWPEGMSCERLPVTGDPDNLCMDKNNQTGMGGGGSSGGSSMNGGGSMGGGMGSGSQIPQPRPTKRPHPATQLPKCKGKNQKNCRDSPGERSRECACKCRPPLVPLGRESQWYNTSVGQAAGVGNCGIPCKGAFFSPEEKEFASVWIALWSGLCCVSTLMTLVTFLIDTERFKYPERPIVFLSACYFMVSLGYLAKTVLGHEEIACDGRVIKYSVSGPSSCTMVFLMVYFFGMASSIWWVVLTFTWFLAAGLKWGNEAIAGYSQYFHLAAWLIPTLQSCAVVVVAAIDGDPVAGICYVGNMNPDNLRIFVLAPLIVYFIVGTMFLVWGFVSLFRIRTVIKQQGGAGAGSKADKLEKLMIRIGIFSVLYTVPATIVIGCHFYEAARLNEWLASLACTCEAISRPLYSVLMLKYFMALAVGITSGVWIWSGKTLDSWRKFWRRLFGTNDTTGAGAVLIKPRCQPHPQAYLPPGLTGGGPGSAAGSLLTTPHPHGGSVASASHHHLHHHVLKQPPLSHV